MKFCYTLLLLFIACTATAQEVDAVFGKITKQLHLSDTASHPDLFLHFDKNVYRANENVWFSAYLLNTPKFSDHHTLHIVLLNEMEQSVVTTHDFVLKEGLAASSFTLPDSLLTGRYCFAAYTNKNLLGQNPYVFRQPIEVIGMRKDPFTIRFEGKIQGDSLVYAGSVTKREGRFGRGRSISFTILADGASFGKLQPTLDRKGNFTFVTPKSLALKQIEVVGKVTDGKDKMGFRQALSYASPTSNIVFYPEGKGLQVGIRSRVAVSLKSANKKGIFAKCILLEDNVQVATFTTDVNGDASFEFVPQRQKNYVVKHQEGNEVPMQEFPPVAENRKGIQLINTIVADTLRLVVSNPDRAEDGVVVIHNSRSMLYGAYVRGQKPVALLKVPVQEWEGGLVYVGLYATNGVLLEQRQVFVNPSEGIKAVLQAEAKKIQPLSPAKIKLRLTDKDGKPLKGVFSFSCVLEQALTPEAKDITTFAHMGRFLPDNIVLPERGGLLTDEKRLKYTLLKQENILAALPVPSAPQYRLGIYDGVIKYNDLPIKSKIDLLLLNTNTTVVSTDVAGNFTLPEGGLEAEPGKRILLSVLHKRPKGYSIYLTSKWEAANTTLAGQNLLRSYGSSDDLSADEKKLLTIKGSITLDEVVITAPKKPVKDYFGKANTSGVCNDYVCHLGFLNCQNHPAYAKLIDGEKCYIETGSTPREITYHCEYKTKEPFIKELEPILPNIAYIPFNPDEINLPETLENTTLHWQALVVTDDNGEATMSFYSNERKGNFRAIAQGITDSGVFSAELQFVVGVD
jgi:hypothetical protein